MFEVECDVWVRSEEAGTGVVTRSGALGYHHKLSINSGPEDTTATPCSKRLVGKIRGIVCE
jgi:hypothetical protein